MFNILIVEDEDSIRLMLVAFLEKKGYKTIQATKGYDAIEIILSKNIDLILLDWMLPDTNGINLIKTIRKKARPKNIPILMLTAKSQESDKVKALNMGADDYLTKPIGYEELAARVKALIRRSYGINKENYISFTGISIHPDKHLLKINNEEINISVTEFKILYFLMQNKNIYFDRQSLINNIWGYFAEVDDRTVDVNILRIRKILKKYNLDKLINTKRGVGYRFVYSEE